MYIYIYINAAVSCKRYPPSLPYIIIVQTCGKRWDLPKFVDVLSVNLGFSQSLICVLVSFQMMTATRLELLGQLFQGGANLVRRHSGQRWWISSTKMGCQLIPGILATMDRGGHRRYQPIKAEMYRRFVVWHMRLNEATIGLYTWDYLQNRHWNHSGNMKHGPVIGCIASIKYE